MSLLVISEILGPFVDTFTADDSLRNSENLWKPIQMKLSSEQKIFLTLLLHFWIVHKTLNIGEKI